MFSNLYITEMNESDIDSVVSITQEIFPFSPFRVDNTVTEMVGPENIHKVSIGILENSTKTFLAISNNKILGFLSWSFDKNITSTTAKRYYRIRLFGVKKEYQRKGIGSELLRYFLNFVNKQKGDIIEVSTDVNNIPAISIYLKFGFFYTSSFSTLRLFPEKFMPQENEELEILKISNVKELDEFVKLRNRNVLFENYPIQCLFDQRIEERTKEIILHNYQKSIELNFNSFSIYIAKAKDIFIGYGAIKEDFSLSSLLSRISGQHISVYRIFDIFVLEEFRNKKVGSTILSKMITNIPKHYNFVEAIVPSHNYAMVNLLRRVGFRLSHCMINLAR